MKTRWNTRASDYTTSPEIDAFLADIRAVCVKHKLSIGHEDDHGAFKIETFDERTMAWLEDASDDRKP